MHHTKCNHEGGIGVIRSDFSDKGTPIDGSRNNQGYLAYVADIIFELQLMTAEQGYLQLSDKLAEAHTLAETHKLAAREIGLK